MMASPSSRAVTTTETLGFTGGTEPRRRRGRSTLTVWGPGPFVVPARWRASPAGFHTLTPSPRTPQISMTGLSVTRSA